MPESYYVLKVAEILEHGKADDGLRAGVKIRVEAGKECVVLIPHEAIGAFLLPCRPRQLTPRKNEMKSVGQTTKPHIPWPLKASRWVSWRIRTPCLSSFA